MEKQHPALLYFQRGHFFSPKIQLRKCSLIESDLEVNSIQQYKDKVEFELSSALLLKN